MAKTANKKITKKIKNRIIKLHLQDISTYEISSQLFVEGLDLSGRAIDKVIREYYKSIGEERIRKKAPRPKTSYTAEEIEEELLNQLKKGRTPEGVYKVAQRMNCLTDKLLSEIESRGYNIPDKIQDEKVEGNEIIIK